LIVTVCGRRTLCMYLPASVCSVLTVVAYAPYKGLRPYSTAAACRGLASSST
jgi:hypothetical protein